MVLVAVEWIFHLFIYMFHCLYLAKQEVGKLSAHNLSGNFVSLWNLKSGNYCFRRPNDVSAIQYHQYGEFNIQQRQKEDSEMKYP